MATHVHSDEERNCIELTKIFSHPFPYFNQPSDPPKVLWSQWGWEGERVHWVPGDDFAPRWGRLVKQMHYFSPSGNTVTKSVMLTEALIYKEKQTLSIESPENTPFLQLAKHMAIESSPF